MSLKFVGFHGHMWVDAETDSAAGAMALTHIINGKTVTEAGFAEFGAAVVEYKEVYDMLPVNGTKVLTSSGLVDLELQAGSNS